MKNLLLIRSNKRLKFFFVLGSGLGRCLWGVYNHFLTKRVANFTRGLIFLLFKSEIETWEEYLNKSSLFFSNSWERLVSFVNKNAWDSKSVFKDLELKFEDPIVQTVHLSPLKVNLDQNPFAWNVQPGLLYS